LKKICIVTGTRAEYGLLRWVIDGVQKSHLFTLQLCVTGMHLSPEFGLTYKEIELDGYNIDSKVEMLLSSDTASGVTKSMGLGLIGFANEFERLKPDLVILLGDRYEIIVAAIAATIRRIPIAHLHGGEKTEGAFDEAIRHSITKMSHLHFVATDEYRKRVVQLGEHPDMVFNVGGLGIDNILKLDLLSRNDLEDSLNFKLGSKNVLVTFHPATLENKTSGTHMEQLLEALKKLQDFNIIFTMPNSDPDSRTIIEKIENFCLGNEKAIAFTSLGQIRYLSCLKYVDLVIGNSSSGLTEVPSFKVPTINIGDRQRGRIKAETVIDCDPMEDKICEAIDMALSNEFQETCQMASNPYGNGGASNKILEIISRIDLNEILKKRFYDL
jgi:GDP/UDP-N,N'-diacetylbacillosamine 2-epimerase (hydrolysing)